MSQVVYRCKALQNSQKFRGIFSLQNPQKVRVRVVVVVPVPRVRKINDRSHRSLGYGGVSVFLQNSHNMFRLLCVFFSCRTHKAQGVMLFLAESICVHRTLETVQDVIP